MLYTGIDKIDTEFGGFEEGRSYLVRGMYGTGKTIVALQFLRFGLEQGEGGLIITAEKGESFLKYAASAGFPLDEFVRTNRLILLEYPVDVDAFINPVLGFDVQDALGELPDYLQLCRATRLVIDPVTPLLTFGLNRNLQGFARTFMTSLANLGCTTLLTSDVHLLPDLQFLIVALEAHVYGTIEMELAPDSGSGIERIMRINRVRGGPISTRTSVFRLEPGRIVCDEPKFEGPVFLGLSPDQRPAASVAPPFFVQKLMREVARARRYNRPLSVVHLSFKGLVARVSMGSKPNGEAVLLRNLQVLGQTSRGTKSFFRYGREKVWVLLTETPKKEAHIYILQMETAVRQALAKEGGCEEGDIPKFQYGIASCPEDGGDARDLITAALSNPRGGDNTV